jgi:four helix bundle protein
LQVASGSASELEYHLLLCEDLGYLVINRHLELENKVFEVRKMLVSLTEKVERARQSKEYEARRPDY